MDTDYVKIRGVRWNCNINCISFHFCRPDTWTTIELNPSESICWMGWIIWRHFPFTAIPLLTWKSELSIVCRIWNNCKFSASILEFVKLLEFSKIWDRVFYSPSVWFFPVFDLKLPYVVDFPPRNFFGPLWNS